VQDILQDHNILGIYSEFVFVDFTTAKDKRVNLRVSQGERLESFKQEKKLFLFVLISGRLHEKVYQKELT